MVSVRASALFRTTRRAVAEGMGSDPHAVWLDYEPPASLAARAPEGLRAPLEALAEHDSPAAHREASAAMQATIRGAARRVSTDIGVALHLDIALKPKGAQPFAFARHALEILDGVAETDIVRAQFRLSTSAFRLGRAGFSVHTAFDYARFQYRHALLVHVPWCTAFTAEISAAGERLLHHLARWQAQWRDQTASDLIPFRLVPDRRLCFFDVERRSRYNARYGVHGDVLSGIHTEVGALARELETELGLPIHRRRTAAVHILTTQIADREQTAQVLWDQGEPLLSAATSIGRRDLHTVADDLGLGLGDRAIVTHAGAIVYTSAYVNRGRPPGIDWSLDPATMRGIAAMQLAASTYHREAIGHIDASVLQMPY